MMHCALHVHVHAFIFELIPIKIGFFYELLALNLTKDHSTWSLAKIHQKWQGNISQFFITFSDAYTCCREFELIKLKMFENFAKLIVNLR